jgi:hypothetical protein
MASNIYIYIYRVAQKEWDIFCFAFKQQEMDFEALGLLFKYFLGYHAMCIQPY